MAKYKSPGVAVYQTIQQTETTVLPDQNVALVGPFASVKLYNASASEQAKAYMGGYTSGAETVLDWERTVGDGNVDFDFTKVYLRNALLAYGTADITVKANKYNQITLTGAGTFVNPDRPVTAGDVVRFTLDGTTVTSAIHSVKSITLDNTVTDVSVVDGDGAETGDILVSGSYTGSEDVTYIVDVIKGGAVGIVDDYAIVRVRTTYGEDVTEEIPLNQPAGHVYKLGTRGLTFTLSGTASTFTQGDSFYYTTNAVADSDTVAITLRQNFPLQAADVSVTGAEFFIVRDITVGSGYFSQTAEHLKISGDISITDYEFGDELLAVAQGDVYAESRIWGVPSTAAVGYGVVNNVTDLEAALPGPIHPASPLKYGIYKALQNSGGKGVVYAIVRDPASIDSWNDAFNRIGKNRDAYALVPLSDDPDVKLAAVGFVNAESSDEINRRKECWLHQGLDLEIGIVTFSHEAPMLATVVDNPDHEGADLFTTVLSDTVDFVEAGVRAGDIFRTNYYVDVEGKTKYDAFTIRQVVNGQSLILATALPYGVDVPQKFEIWRPTTSANFTENIGKLNTWNNRRVILVYPFTLSADGYTIDGFYGAAMAAALTTSFNPNQASTQKNLSGISAITGYDELSEQNLNDLATQGVTIFASNEDGDIFLRHTLTSGNFDILHEREEMSTRNFDSISNYYTAALAPLRGNVHATQVGLAAVFDAVQKASDRLKLRHADTGTSGQIVDYVIRSVAIDEVFLDVIIIHVDLELPLMANRIELYLQVVAENSALGTVYSTTLVG